MSTASEKRWLEDRKLSPTPFCGWCMKYALCCSPRFTKCPTKTADLGDALEFEGHVVARLARMMLRPNDNKYPCRDGVPDAGCMRDKTRLTGPHAVHCEDCILREVRFEIEEAMDGHNNA